MGGIGASFTDPYHINIQNPASYSFLRSTSFDLGLEAKYSSLTNNTESFTNWSGNLDYMVLAFPLRNPLNEVFDRSRKQYWLGMSFALLPYSNVAYNITTFEQNEEIGEIARNYTGKGGSYKIQWGNAIRFKTLSFGLNLGYIFGKIENSRNIDFNDQVFAFNNRYLTDYDIKGFTWNAGVIYSLYLNRDEVKNVKGTEAQFVNFGLFGNSATGFSTNATIYQSNQFVPNFNLIESDTLLFQENVKGNGKLPSELGIGVTYYKGSKLSIGANIVRSGWSSYANDAQPEQLNDVTKYSFGGFYRPNAKSFSYRDRVYYRYGAFYNQDGRSILQEPINDYGVNIGFGLPFVYQRKVSHINIGFTGGRRGNDSLRETYVKIGIGLTFNDDEWFIKRKYN